MIRLSRAVALTAAIFIAAPAFAGPGDKAIDDVRILSADDMQGRLVGTPGSEKARAYILSRFAEIGLSPLGDKFEQTFEFAKRDGTKVTGTNLVARIKGTEGGKALVVSAHYDHLGVRDGQVYNGADDNASGVAGLLAVAEAFKAKPPKHDVILAVVDAEEGGLRGAKAFVANPPVPLAMIAHWEAWASEEQRAPWSWVARRHEIDYRRELLPGEIATGYTWVGELKGPRFERYVRIDGPDGEMCAQSRTDWVLIDIAAKRPARVLPWMVERFTPKG